MGQFPAQTGRDSLVGANLGLFSAQMGPIGGKMKEYGDSQRELMTSRVKRRAWARKSVREAKMWVAAGKASKP